ncbi:unnamed protein product [Nesidiocoris tenuis]|uniref:Major facilitator superfamily (MFS) profile domain-containing protein n=1 Tax=Nesidiocoris tenuis TaxID=355587 RepID=A0A6H5HS78_9HEMI|nr:unnamed protein product [Nesidiocoris tenuis]
MEEGNLQGQNSSILSVNRLAVKSNDGKHTHLLLTIAPDGGWAWVVLFVSTWNCLCIDGVSLGYSVIQDHVMKELKIDGVQSSLCVAMFNGIVYLNGPITAALANRFGFRPLNLIGGVIGAIGLLSCYFSNSYIFTLTSFALVGGIGGSLIYMVSMACPGYWFETRRSLAFGVSNSATGIAAFVIPAISEVIVHKSSWTWVFVLLGSMFFGAFLLGFLLIKPPMLLMEMEAPEPRAVETNVTLSILNVRTGGGRRVDDKVRDITYSSTVVPPKTQLSYTSVIEEPQRKCCRCQTGELHTNIERPLYRADIFFQSRTDAAAKNANMTHTDYTLSVHNMATKQDILQNFKCVCCPEAITRPLKDMLSLSLMKNFVYLVMLLDTMLYFSAVYVTYLFVPRTSRRKGIDEGTSILILQLFGAFMATSRILLGLVFHFFPDLPPHYFAGINVFVGGIFHAALALTTDKITSCIIGGISGFLIGVWLPMRSILVVRYIGLDKLTNAMGMLFVFQAIGSFYGAPLAELLRESFDEDYMTHYFAGAMYVISGALILPLEMLNSQNEIVSVERPMYKSDIFLASRTDFMAKKQNMTQSDYMMSVHRMTTARDIEQQFECLCCPEAITRPLQEMLGVALLKNVVFWFLLVGTLVYYSAIFVTYLYMPRTSERKGLGIKIGLLSLQLFGLTTALTRISLGVVFHFFPQLPPHYFTGAYVVLGGICQLSMSLTTNAIATCTLGALVGFFTGVWLPMRSILIVRYMGLDKLTNAMGMLFVFQAVGGLIGAPAAETLIKFFNEDYVSYYFSGSLFTISGLLIFPLECLNNIITKKGRQN